MKVGVLPTFDRQWGGVFQYCQMVLTALAELRDAIDPVLVFAEADREAARALEAAGWKTLSFAPPTPRGVARRMVARTLGESAASSIGGMLRRGHAAPAAKEAAEPTDHAPARLWLERNRIDLMLYPAPMTLSFELGLPYVMAVHDLQHRLHPEFPEVSADGELEQREHLYVNGIQGAEAILVDSEVGREDVLELYGHLTSPGRVWVLPYILPPAMSSASEGSAPAAGLASGEPYFLFPAQFWPHKNHVRVTQAVADLHRTGLDVTVVMTGSTDFQNRQTALAEVRGIARREGVEHLIRLAGYVDDETIARLYRDATAVILPTFFGPTNIPVIEAWAVGVPVLTSDIRGIREQCGDAALLVDPTSTSEIAEGLRRLWTDPALRSRLAAAGSRRLQANDPSAFRDRLGEVLVAAVSSKGRTLAGAAT